MSGALSAVADIGDAAKAPNQQTGMDVLISDGRVNVRDVRVPGGMAAGWDHDGRVGRPDARGAGEDRQVFDGARRVRRGRLDVPGTNAQTVQLGDRAGARLGEGLEEHRRDGRAMDDVGMDVDTRTPIRLRKDRGERDTEPTGDRIKRLNRRIAARSVLKPRQRSLPDPGAMSQFGQAQLTLQAKATDARADLRGELRGRT